MKLVDYTIISVTSSAAGLEHQVGESMSQGWIPLGAPVVAGTKVNPEFYQAMTLTADAAKLQVKAAAKLAKTQETLQVKLTKKNAKVAKKAEKTAKKHRKTAVKNAVSRARKDAKTLMKATPAAELPALIAEKFQFPTSKTQKGKASQAKPVLAS